MSLTVENRIYVPTYNGEKEIQLCLGDITKLPVEDKVDVIVVSALPGDYSATRISVIGALKRNLNLSVRDLHSAHTENYMRTCQCWVSQPLPPHLPYRKLICWENYSCSKTDKDSLSHRMRELFRALMPVFNTANSSVIIPLLGSGIQGIEKVTILEAMVNSAAAWMRMGLPLQTLKIVIYVLDKDKISTEEQNCIKLFKNLKAKHERNIPIPKDPVPEFDIFMIFCEDDEIVIHIKDRILSMDSKIRFKSWKEVSSEETAWQHNMYNTMLRCNRIVPFITSQYLNNKECVDLYNLALCCNRRTRRNILAPLMLEKMLTVPGYMKMVQWLDARTPDKHTSACQILLDQIKEGEETAKYNYDIFISYSHKSPVEAKKLCDAFHKRDEKLKIFFDYEELKSGVSWQQTLYKAIDGSQCMVAMVSQSYLESAVCTEEFNLSLAKNLTEEKPLEIIPVCVQPVDLSQNAWLSDANPVKAYEKDTDRFIETLADAVVEWLNSGVKNEYFASVKERINLEIITAKERAGIFKNNYTFQNGEITLKIAEKATSNKSSEKKSENCDVLFSYALRDQRYVQLIKQLLTQANPLLKIVDRCRSDIEQNHHLETAQVIVVLLSPTYLQSKKEIEELNIIINRERASKNKRILYTVQLDLLPEKPTYARLLPCDTCLVDDFWKDVVQMAATQGGFSFGPSIDQIRVTVEKEWEAFRDEEITAVLKICCDVLAATDDSIKPTNHHNDVILCNITQLDRNVLNQSSQNVDHHQDTVKSYMSSPQNSPNKETTLSNQPQEPNPHDQTSNENSPAETGQQKITESNKSHLIESPESNMDNLRSMENSAKTKEQQKEKSNERDYESQVKNDSTKEQHNERPVKRAKVCQIL